MNKTATRWIAIIGIAGLMIFFAAKRWGGSDSNSQSTMEASANPGLPGEASSGFPVDVQILHSERLVDLLTVSGTLKADETVNVSSEIAGKVQRIYFTEGAFVKAGQVLVKLDDADLQAELTKVEFQRDLAQQQETRRKQLLEKGGLSQEEYDQALTELNTYEAEIELLKVRIGKTSIHAPFSGKIGFRLISEGSYLSPGTQVAQLVKSSPIKIAFSVPERYSTKMVRGLSITYTVEGLDDTLYASVYATRPTIDPETRTLEVKARGTNPNGVLAPGTFATVTVQLDEYPRALMIPNRAVMPQREKQVVYRFNQGKAEAVDIKTGIRLSDRVQVLNGLSEGDTLIVSGLIQMSPGQEVTLNE